VIPRARTDDGNTAMRKYRDLTFSDFDDPDPRNSDPADDALPEPTCTKPDSEDPDGLTVDWDNEPIGWIDL
jgi:hypothetical protein